MPRLKYTIIKSKKQYHQYSLQLEGLLDSGSRGKSVRDEIDLLTLLIEKWDEAHNTFNELDPIELLNSLMTDQEMKAKDLVDLLDVSKGYVSDILHYKSRCHRYLSNSETTLLSNSFLRSFSVSHTMNL